MTEPLGPVEASERYPRLDLLRGVALFGVLVINLLYFFRVSLFDHMLRFHSHAGWWNHAIDLVVAALVEFKAFDLFSLTFGAGMAIQWDRARLRGVLAEGFLARRFLILFAFGAAHMLLVSNVDILALYAICGMAAIALLRLPTPVLAALGVVLVWLPSFLPGGSLPLHATHAAEATRVYGQGSFAEALVFRFRETQDLILPLLVGVAQKTLGLMVLGVVLWRQGVVQRPEMHRHSLWLVCAVAGTIGGANTLAELTGKDWVLRGLGSHVPLALAYAAAVFAWRGVWGGAIAAAGKMALTNYLMQSLVLAAIFYGYGLGLFGRLDPAIGMVLGVAIYAAQVWWSANWLRGHRFGPFEWLWRSLTYGRQQRWRTQ